MEGIDHDIPENNIFEIETIVQNLGWYSLKAIATWGASEPKWNKYHYIIVSELKGFLFIQFSLDAIAIA